jgi:hypothetical protein
MKKRALAGLVVLSAAAFGQDFTQRGTLEYRGWLYPEHAWNDRGHAIGETLFRYEFTKTLIGPLKLAGTTETRIDTHRQTERRFYVNFGDRRLQRPPFSIRRASLLYNRGRFTAEGGKQLIRWGKADVLNPTDRFAPRDYLSVVDTEFLGVLAGRAIWETASDSLEVVVQPRFTPSRLPLLNQRWTVLPDELRDVPVELTTRYPGGVQYGLRWNHLGAGYEASLSYYDGRHHLPLFEGTPTPPGVTIQRFFPRLRMYGGDAAVPLRWITIKGEAAWFTSTTPQADEYVLYVLQGERQFGEASIVAGYAGEAVTKRRNPFDFAPDRGLARSFLGRASYTLDPRRSFAAEWAIRQNGDGLWTRFEYSQDIGKGWRAIGNITLIRGVPGDFLGQYHRNSNVSLLFRYTF